MKVIIKYFIVACFLGSIQVLMATDRDRFNYYPGISHDGIIYGEFSNSKIQATQLMKRKSGRDIVEVGECSAGWYAGWTFKVIHPKATYVGVACNRNSKAEAITAALKACQQRGGSNCLRANGSDIVTSVDVTVLNFTNEMLDKGNLYDADDGPAVWCRVYQDGAIDGTCSLKNELMTHGVYFGK